MTEDHGPYARRPDLPREDGVQHIRDVLHQYIDEQGWDRHLLPEPNGPVGQTTSGGEGRTDQHAPGPATAEASG